MPNSAQLAASLASWKLACWSRMGSAAVVGGRRMVGGGDRALGVADRQAAPAEALEGLRAGDLVDEVEVDADDGRRAGLLEDDVVVPDLLDERARAWRRRWPPRCRTCRERSRGAGRAPRRRAPTTRQASGFARRWNRCAACVRTYAVCATTQVVPHRGEIAATEREARCTGTSWNGRWQAIGRRSRS